MSDESILDRIRSNQRATVPKRSDALIVEPTKQPPTIEQLQAELNEIPKTRRHSAIVLEEDISLELTQFCKREGITIETFLEALWLSFEAYPQFQGYILEEARLRYAQRKRAGQLRRLITMLSKNQESQSKVDTQ